MTSMNITGSILVRRIFTDTDDGEHLTYEWQGGDIIGISHELLEDAQDGVFSTRAPVLDEHFTIGPFHVICVGVDERIIYAKRADRMIGLRVHFASLLTSKTYTGTIAGKHGIFDAYMVKLDTGQIMTNVRYYDSEPIGEISASFWQVCWPTGEGVLPGEHEELT